MKQSTLGKYEQQVLKALVYIQNNLDGNLMVKAISDHVYYSQFHFQRVFSELSGIPVKKYIINLRLQRAAMKLSYSKMPIAIIARQSGYNTHEAFTRAFTEKFDMTPSKFRTYKSKFQPLQSINGYATARGLDSKFIDSSNIVAEKFGLKKSENMIGKSFEEMNCDISERAEIPTYFDQLTFRRNKPVIVCARYMCADNNPVYSISSRHPYYDEHGKVCGLYNQGVGTNSEILKTLLDTLSGFNFTGTKKPFYFSFIIDDDFNLPHLSKTESDYLFFLLRKINPTKLAQIFKMSQFESAEIVDNLKQKLGVAQLDELYAKAEEEGHQLILPKRMMSHKALEALEFARN